MLKRRAVGWDRDDALLPRVSAQLLFPAVNATFHVPSGARSARKSEWAVMRGLRDLGVGCIFRRMPRMQLYLPDDLYALVKARSLPASELLQKAVRAELRRLDLLEESASYLAALQAEVGEPTAAERARAKALVERITKRSRRKTG